MLYLLNEANTFGEFRLESVYFIHYSLGCTLRFKRIEYISNLVINIYNEKVIFYSFHFVPLEVITKTTFDFFQF